MPFLASCILLKSYLALSHRYKFGYQHIRSDGPISHIQNKRNIPTSAGLLLSIVLIISNHYLCINPTILKLNTAIILFTLIGFADDYLKIRKGRNLIHLSSLLAGILLFMFHFSNLSYLNLLCIGYVHLILLNAPLEQKGLTSIQKLTAQLLASFACCSDMSLLFMILAIIFITGVSNAVNICDGLDGLISVPLILCFMFYAIFYYLDFGFILASTLLAYLLFNWPKARLFMGDSGSLMFGAMLAIFALHTHTPFLLIILGGVFLTNILSVAAQIISIRRYKKRIFLMAPLHHHFELKGYTEKQIVLTVWLIQVILTATSIVLIV